MKIIFIGNIIFSQKMLHQLDKMRIEVSGVITGFKNANSDYYDLTKFCIKKKIPFIKVKDINSFISFQWIKKIYPDLVLCFGWSQLISDKIISIPRKGVIGYHPTELPANKGKHPLIWSLVLGLNKSASTFFLINKNVDDGPIISQKKFNISKKEDAESLYLKISKIACKQLKYFLPKYLKNQIKPFKSKKAISNIWRKRIFLDGEINWNMDAAKIYNLIRGLSKPYPGAHFRFKNKIYKVWKAKIGKDNNKNIEPGKVISLKNRKFEIKCGKGSIYLEKIQPLLNTKVNEYL